MTRLSPVLVLLSAAIICLAACEGRSPDVSSLKVASPEIGDGAQATAEPTSIITHPINARLDSDQDGVPDAEEIRDGTDPNDPSSARAWHPYDLPPFPRLIADQARWDEVRANVQAGAPPYVQFYQQAVALADTAPQTPQGFDYDPAVAQYNAMIARAAAVRFWNAGDPADAAKASVILRNTDPNFEAWTYETVDKGDIQLSQALIFLCQTYEILVVTNGFGPGEADAAATVLRSLADSFFNFYANRFPIWLMATRNNHNVRFDSSLAYAAMTLNDWSEAARLVNFGLTEAVHWQFEEQDCSSMGCCAEGPDYLSYSSQCFLPFFVAYHRFARGRAFPYKVSCNNRLPGCREEVIEVDDPDADPRLTDVLDWWLHLRLPDGHGALLDDSSFHCLSMGVASALTGDGRFRWAYDNGSQCAQFAGDLSWEQLLLLPDLPDAVAPTNDDLFYVNEEAGQAVMRSSADEDGLYLLLNAEHGAARTHGMGHEQPDNTSFMMMAYGEFFMIDSGYITYDERRRTAGPENHSLILVDGKGPWRGINGFLSDVDADLTESQRDDTVAWSVAEATWAGSHMRRLAGLVENRYFVVVDWVQGGAHEYDWLGHTNAGGSTGGVIASVPGGVTIERANAQMALFVDALPTTPALSLQDAEHGFYYGQADTHSVLHATLTAENPVFISLFMPAPAGEALPTLFAEQNDGANAVLAVSTDADVMVWAASRSGQGVHFKSNSGPLPEIDSDADLVMVRYDPVTYAVNAEWRHGGTYLNITPPGLVAR